MNLMDVAAFYDPPMPFDMPRLHPTICTYLCLILLFYTVVQRRRTPGELFLFHSERVGVVLSATADETTRRLFKRNNIGKLYLRVKIFLSNSLF